MVVALEWSMPYRTIGNARAPIDGWGAGQTGFDCVTRGTAIPEDAC
jgi:hypothetical protein